jgi:hypothetical protein
MVGVVMNSNDNEKRDCISKAITFYEHYDTMYSGVVWVDNHRQLSTNGQSIMNDLEYYLRLPKYRAKIEAAILEQLRGFAEVILQEE